MGCSILGRPQRFLLGYKGFMLESITHENAGPSGKIANPCLPSNVFLLLNQSLASCHQLTLAQEHHVLCGPYSCCRGQSEHPSSPIRRGSRFGWSRTTFLGRRVVEGVLGWEQDYPVGGGALGAAMGTCIVAPATSALSSACFLLPLAFLPSPPGT